jgi:hypothetical protein
MAETWSNKRWTGTDHRPMQPVESFGSPPGVEGGSSRRELRPGTAIPRLPACLRVAACVLAAFVLVEPRVAHGQRLQTYVHEGREPELPRSGPLGPVPSYEVLRIDIGTGVTLPHKKQFYGVTAIAMQEKGDEGCKLELYGNLLDPDEPSTDILLGTGTLFGCDEGGDASWARATVNTQPNQFVRSVRACYGNSPFVDLKIKGLMVSAAALVSDNGKLLSLPEFPCVNEDKTPHCFARPHCGSWSNMVTCPVGEIVTGVSVYHYAENDRPPRAISAIQPWCQGLRNGKG